ncbi:MAG: ornithine--oxo-acid transaminase [Deltaproteobacteria bacterium CG11_big_fil_rev_8_21_14_0_20_49_13]|nr:MAG: ornithine--oxo-acid transaminase [Deltaproteobacteria bacterium CG11_big_fil_rev_8_21_14_0_20_49_13]
MTRTTQDYINEVDKVSAHNYHPLPVVISKGEGVWVWDVDGKKYIDMLSAYSALNQGHNHPRVIAAAKKQMDSLTLTSRAFHNDQMGPFLAKLTKLAGYDKALPMNTGAEGVETAIKAARRWGYKVKKVPEGKAEIIVCSDNFHGRTTTIVGFSTDPVCNGGFGPFTPGFKIIPYGDTKALSTAMTPNTVGFMVEPIQGEAGVKIPPKGYLKECYAITKKNHVLFIADEIQTGLGRTGKLFCFEHEGVRPEIVIIGKALGGGVYPVSGILADDPVMMAAFEWGNHGSTFGGNPLACAVASAAIDVLIDEKLIDRSREMGEYFVGRLANIRSPKIKEARGMGLLCAVELKKEAGHARNYTEALVKEGVLAKETHETTIRFAPPLVIKKEEIDWAVERIAKVLA